MSEASPKTILIYGSYGYTGKLIVELAKEHFSSLKKSSLEVVPQIILSGRSLSALTEQATSSGFPIRHFVLSRNDTPERVKEELLLGVGIMLNCAGPFIETAGIIAEACILAKCHYLDITGEAEVFELLQKFNEQAKKSGVMIFPGCGFDVVPSDCLLSHVANRIPRVNQLDLILGSKGSAGFSRGTSLTIATNLDKPLHYRENGVLVSVPFGKQPMLTDRMLLPNTKTVGMLISWGDISTAYFSTKIPNIRTYTVIGSTAAKIIVWLGVIWPWVSWIVKPFMVWYTRNFVKGPSDEQRTKTQMILRARAKSADGQVAVSKLVCPEGYNLTAMTSLDIALKVVNGNFKAGFQTPSTAYGSNFILSFPGVERIDEI